ncbi:kinase domain protein (macronuclear) [Tetrahymena thermophila SB210]|uniref:Kinase domain protein n=1 Tax=Tetrahymena thermophila (strain SB210) TaxID=312017 RepID=Q22C12_TETTS|nr:kinase domain protein [Tetrahymena thermophila SB210]EAR82850.1 kinase domain protein [Tetrahymena thermophila SB210]|eukprot:XP_001030513.1 kinase domain protein [Tetrahymena thermophila SB210]
MSILEEQFNFNCQSTNLRLNYWHQKVNPLALSFTLQKCQQLVNLNIDLSRNMLGDEGLINFSTFLEHMTNLQSIYVDLSFNSITEVGMKNLATNLSKCKSLRRVIINFQYNGLNEASIMALAQGMKQCRNINKINLNFKNNRIRLDSHQKLSREFQKYCKRLVCFKISF